MHRNMKAARQAPRLIPPSALARLAATIASSRPGKRWARSSTLTEIIRYGPASRVRVTPASRSRA